MTRRTQNWYQSKNAKKRRENLLQRSRKGVAAKAIKRMANPVEREPKMERFYPLSFGVKDNLTGETAWVPLRSIRDTAKRVGVVLRYYQSGKTRLSPRVTNTSGVSVPAVRQSVKALAGIRKGLPKFSAYS